MVMTRRQVLVLRRGALAVLAAADSDAADRELVEAYTFAPPDVAFVESAARLAAAAAPPW